VGKVEAGQAAEQRKRIASRELSVVPPGLVSFRLFLRLTPWATL
jgi:hypothetical protein